MIRALFRSTALTALVLGLLPVASGPVRAAAEPASCEAPRLASSGWADIDATNAVAITLLRATGYRPSVQTLSVPLIYQGLRSAQLDVYLGNWMPAQRELVEPFFRQGQVERIATNLEKARFTLAVPEHVAQAGVRSFADLQAHAERFGRKLYGIEPGAPANQILRGMINRGDFGLTGWSLIESSDSALSAQLERTLRATDKPWMVFLAWEPHVINTRYRITYLQGGDAQFGPDYGAAMVHTVARKGYVAQCANLGRLFAQLRFSVPLENELLQLTVGQRMAVGQAATTLLRRHPELLDGWLKGVVTTRGGEALPAVREALGIPAR